jgi:hypothetical protein
MATPLFPRTRLRKLIWPDEALAPGFLTSIAQNWPAERSENIRDAFFAGR